MTSNAPPPGTHFDPSATQLRFAPANRALLEAICRQDFTSFIHRSFNALTPGQRLAMNWHIQALAFHLEQVRHGELRRLIVNMPPRSLKSLITSVSWPAFVLGHDPTKRLIVASYASELSIKHANDFRALLSADWYKKPVSIDAHFTGKEYGDRGRHDPTRLSPCHIGRRHVDGPWWRHHHHR